MSISSTYIASGSLEPGIKHFSRRQEEVLAVVESVFLREGIRAVRMGQLADEARCSRSTLYDLALSKEDLLLLVLDRLMRRISIRGAEAIARTDDPVEKIRAMMTSGALDFADLGPHFLEAIRQSPPARLLFDRRVDVGLQFLQELINEAVRTQAFRAVNATVIAEAIFAVVMRFTDPSFARSTKVSTSAGLAELVDVLVDGLRPRSADRRPASS